MQPALILRSDTVYVSLSSHSRITKGDMYESTVDVLYLMYEKLSVGGFVIMDDWYGFPIKIAVRFFF